MISVDLATQVLTATLRGFGAVLYPDTYLSLHTAAPGETGASEVSGGGYSRRKLDWGTPIEVGDEVQIATTERIEVMNMPAVTVTHWAVRSSAVGSGGVLYAGALDTPRSFESGMLAVFQAGDLVVRIGPT